MYRVADPKGVLKGRVIVKGVLYRVGETRGSLRGEGAGVLLRIIASCHGYQGMSKGWEGYCHGYIVSCRGYQGWFEGEWVLLRVFCIVSLIPTVV